MLIQIHHQDKKTGASEMISQIEIPDETDSSGDYNILREEMYWLWKKKPPPKGMQYMICTEKS
ncbi:MAG: hypothetical protein V1690_03815, partial [Candidatus Moraniibacteriota bacterium]